MTADAVEALGLDAEDVITSATLQLLNYFQVQNDALNQHYLLVRNDLFFRQLTQLFPVSPDDPHTGVNTRVFSAF